MTHTHRRIPSTAGRAERLVAMAALALAGCQVACAQPTPPPADGGHAVNVQVVKPVRRAVVRELAMPATLMADEQVDLFAKTSGYVADIDVDIGDHVSKGDVLVGLSVPEMADELHQAEAVVGAKRARVRALQAKATQAQRMVETARAQVRRYEAEHRLGTINLTRKQALRKGNAIPEQALDEATSAHAITEAKLQIAQAGVAGAEAELQAVEADVEVAESEVTVALASVARLKTLMAYASIRAPFDGVIAIRSVDHGAFVRSATEGTATALLRVVKTDRIRIALDIPEMDAVYVRVGTKVDIDVKALAAPPFSATVSRTARALNPATRTMRAEIDIDNPDGRFAPGMYAQVVVNLESKASAMMIPSKAIRASGDEMVVLVSVDGVVKSKPVRVGHDDGIWAEIVSGLDGGELIITSTGGAIAPGTAVSPVFVGS
ncbi:MAG: efflux RND transporter periplasmic adaptor subunit [Phycisphaerae bacterium]